MKILLFVSCVLSGLQAMSQYYYNDLIGSKDLSARMQALVNGKVRTVTASGIDARGARNADFNEWQEVNAAALSWRISTRNGMNVAKQTYRFNSSWQLLSIADTSGTIRSLTTYTYDAGQRITRIETTVNDSLQDFSETETHVWEYNAQGQPQRIWRILNQKDTTEYRLTTDEQGRVADEQLYRRNTGFDPIYYYYDDNNRITDIVRYDKQLKKLLPDFMFEYDDNDRVIQKIATLSTKTRDYIIWRFAYDSKGLKNKEALFNKQKELTGRIEYNYTYLP